jgi:hypothetical protein
MGWGNSDLAQRLGVEEHFVWLLASGRQKKVQVRTYRNVVEVHRGLWDKEPPQETFQDQTRALRAVRRAARYGWVTTAAWEDIDDPDEEPYTPGGSYPDLVDKVAVRRVVSGHAAPTTLTPAEKKAAVRLFASRNVPVARAAKLLRMSYDTAKKAVAA